jgi:hypothetical protein
MKIAHKLILGMMVPAIIVGLVGMYNLTKPVDRTRLVQVLRKYMRHQAAVPVVVVDDMLERTCNSCPDYACPSL